MLRILYFHQIANLIYKCRFRNFLAKKAGYFFDKNSDPKCWKIHTTILLFPTKTFGNSDFLLKRSTFSVILNQKTRNKISWSHWYVVKSLWIFSFNKNSSIFIKCFDPRGEHQWFCNTNAFHFVLILSTRMQWQNPFDPFWSLNGLCNIKGILRSTYWMLLWQ